MGRKIGPLIRAHFSVSPSETLSSPFSLHLSSSKRVLTPSLLQVSKVGEKLISCADPWPSLCQSLHCAGADTAVPDYFLSWLWALSQPTRILEEGQEHHGMGMAGVFSLSVFTSPAAFPAQLVTSPLALGKLTSSHCHPVSDDTDFPSCVNLRVALFYLLLIWLLQSSISSVANTLD